MTRCLDWRAFLAAKLHVKWQLLSPTLMNHRTEAAMSSHKPVRLMTPDEAAGFLSVSTRTLKRLVAEGELGAVKIRGSMRFKLEDLEAFIEANRWS